MKIFRQPLTKWIKHRSLRLHLSLAGSKRIPAGLKSWWSSLSRRRRFSLVTGLVLAAMVVSFGVYTWSGISAALEARQSYRELEAELSHLTPVDLIQVNVYQSLEHRFQKAEESSARARSRLAFLRAFRWIPVLGSRIEEAQILLEMGYYQGRAGRNLASVYRAAIASPTEGLEPEEVAQAVAQAIRESAPQLNQAQEDLRRVVLLREQLGVTERGSSYGVLVDRYLPALQTVIYLSRTSPEVIGHTYTLSGELSKLQELAVDPLDVLANPEDVGKALDHITEQATALEAALEVVRKAINAVDTDDVPELAAVRDVLDTLIPGVTLLRHVTAGTRSLLIMTEAMESSGFLSKEFGFVVGIALDEAEQELSLAREEAASLRTLLSVQGIDAQAFLPSIVFGSESGVSISSTERLEVKLDEAINATRFLRSFLGFEGPRTYLLLGQNQNEIRASGGFIGIAVQVMVDKGELIDLVYHDSVTVDKEPLIDNPAPPEGLFWYLWMGRLLFRDSNWSPHFPASAAKVAELFRHGQGVQVDGVMTATKLLSFDLVETFGNVTVLEVEGVLTKQDAEAYAEGILPYVCLPRHLSTRGKRCFDEDLFFALKERLTTGIPAPVRRQVVTLIQKELDRKNILLHVFPPIDDSFLWERGWNGAVPFVDHDYLMVVDSSLPGHTTAIVKRSWEYRVSLDPSQRVEAQLRLRYDNGNQPSDETCIQTTGRDCYWNYFRVYVSPMSTKIRMPKVPLHHGSLKLIWGYPDADSSSVVTNSDTGPARLTELAGYVTVEADSITTIPIEYQLPGDILRSTGPGAYEYRLLIQKQAGMDRDKVNVSVELPPDAELLATTPEYSSTRGRWLIFDFNLEADTIVALSFRMKEAS